MTNRGLFEKYKRFSTNAYALALGMMFGAGATAVATWDSDIAGAAFAAGGLGLWLVAIGAALYWEGKYHGLDEYDGEEHD